VSVTSGEASGREIVLGVEPVGKMSSTVFFFSTFAKKDENG
jgi:hypothetical protein